MSDEGQRLIAHTQLVRAERQIQRAVNEALDQHREYAFDSISLTASAPPDPFRRDSWATTVKNTVRPVIEQVLSTFVERVIKALDLEDKEPVARANIDYQTDVDDFAGLIENHGYGIADDVFSTIQEGIALDEDTDVIIQRVDRRFEVGRSGMASIVRTETHDSAERTKLQAAVVAQRAGFRMTKRWVTIFDGRARRTHIRAMGQEIDLHADFHVGKGSGPRPGAIGLPEEDIQCRCAAIYRRLDDDADMPAAQTDEDRDENERQHSDKIEENKS